MVVALNAVVSWGRVLSWFVVSATLGPLQIMMIKMLRDVMMFFALFIFILLGFTFAMYQARQPPRRPRAGGARALRVAASTEAGGCG